MDRVNQLVPHNKSLLPFQKTGVEYLISSHHGLLGDDMGLGKTIQVLAALNAVKASHILIICPASVKYHWLRKIKEWMIGRHNVFLASKGHDNIPPSANIIIINYDLLIDKRVAGSDTKKMSRLFRQLVARSERLPFHAIVLDEAHYLKNIKAVRTRKILGQQSFLHRSFYIWALSGTFMPNRPAELYPMLYTLARKAISPYESYTAYGKQFCANFSKDGEYRGASNLDDLAERIKPYFLRRNKEDVLKELPDKVETTIELDGVEIITDDCLPTSTARRELAMAKIPKFALYVKDLLTTIDKVVVFAHHRDAIETLAKIFVDLNPSICYGGMTAEKKQQNIDAFRNIPNVRMFIGQTLAGGIGVDGLQGVCSYVCFLEPDWSPGYMDQAIDRLRRIGQKNTVFVYYFVVPGSLDDKINETLDEKRIVIGRIMKANEVLKMSLDSLLERAVAALEKIAASSSGEEVEKPKGKAPGGGRKTTQAQAPVPAGGPAPAQQFTRDDVIAAATKYVVSWGDDNAQAAAKNHINTNIWPRYATDSIANLAPEHFAAVIQEFSSPPPQPQAPAATAGI